MKIAVVGVGGVGGYYGGQLAASGADVVFIARGKQLQALRENGLTIEGPNSKHIFPVKVSDKPSDFGPVDLVIIAVKLWDLESTLQEIKPFVNDSTAILSLQNGITKDELIAKHYGKKHVLGGVCYVTASIERPGVIKQIGQSARIIVGEYDNQPSKRAEEFNQLCLKAGLDATISNDILKSIWEKFVYLVAFSAITTVTRLPIGPLLANPQTRELFLNLMQEVTDVGIASNVHLDRNYAQNRLAFADKLSGDIRASTAVDFEKGNRLEVDWLSGKVSQMGKKLGIPTPCNTIISAILSPYANGKPV